MNCVLSLLAEDSTTGISKFQWIAMIVAALILLIVGCADVLRLRWRRIWALSGVCFTESLRRRVYLVTVLAIAGVVVVSQLQTAVDDQMLIRQTVKFCIFATGLVVVLTALILACTSLPREIESRVIFTVVTKPATRLEIVLGKVIGFSRVTALILLIMGVFSFIYLEARDRAHKEIARNRLALLSPDAVGRATLAHFAEHGYLETRSFEAPAEFNIYSRLPESGLRWIRSGSLQYFVSHFALSDDERSLLQTAVDQNAEVDLLTSVQVRRLAMTHDEQLDAVRQGIPTETPRPATPFGPSLTATTQPALPTDFKPGLQFRLVNGAEAELVKSEQLLARPGWVTAQSAANDHPSSVERLSPDAIHAMVDNPDFYIEVAGATPAMEFGVGSIPSSIFIPAANDGHGVLIQPRPVPGESEPVRFLSRPGKYGMVIEGSDSEGHGVGLFSFRNATKAQQRDGLVSFEMRTRLERTEVMTREATALSLCEVRVYNRDTGQSSGPIHVSPEIGQQTFFDVPAEFVAGGNFDVSLRGLVQGEWVDVTPQSIVLVSAERSFVGNLIKSMFLLWMLSVLVISISVFCSTFLSWPIAVVVTLLLLLGRWGVTQLGDTLNPGVGRGVASNFFVQDAAEAKVVSSTVEALSKALRTVAVVLPDVSQFPASEDIERGVGIAPAVLAEAAESLAVYGMITIVGGYLILRFAEVAP